MCEISESEYFKVKEPKIGWSDIGGYKEIKERLDEMIALPLKYPEAFEKARLRPSTGILIWGPPRCGMKALIEAAAKSANARYILAKPEIMKKESEIPRLYKTAAELVPCVIFISDIDELAPRREAKSAFSSPKKVAPQKITRILFHEIDNVGEKVITIGGTHRPDMLDPALLRNGRLERKIYLPLPDYYDRLEILKIATNTIPLEASLEKLAEITQNYTTLDILSLLRQAVLFAIKEKGKDFDKVEMKHFKMAVERIPPSISPETAKRYEEIYKEECKHRYMY
jgi:SpoVK/Ycf46/Vps4 family AAA+-type ATPase